jgi:hypothetical protein
MRALTLPIAMALLSGCSTFHLYAPDSDHIAGRLIEQDEARGRYRIEITNSDERPAQYIRRANQEGTPMFYFSQANDAPGDHTCVGCDDDGLHDALLESGANLDVVLDCGIVGVSRIGVPFMDENAREFVVWIPVAE